MRPTRLGVFAAFMAAFTLFAAGSTGNNLLYMLFAATVTSIVVSFVAGRWNLRRLSARLEAPEQVFRGSPFTARVVVANEGGGTARLIRAVGPMGASAPGDVPPGGALRAELRLTLPHRGLNRLDGLILESHYPFGLFTMRRRVPAAEVLALPQAGPFQPQDDLETDPRAVGAGARSKAREGEFFGPRPYAPEDDARLIHWKLTAKTGRPVVAEYARAPEGRAVVRLDGVDDVSVERAASACRWYIDSGVETGLAGAGVEVAPARGLSQLDKLLRALALVGEGGRSRSAPAAPSARDEGPADTKTLRRLTLLGGVLVYAALFLIDDLSPTSLLYFLPLIPLGAWLQERDGPFPPQWLWNILSAGMLVYLVTTDWRRSGVALANAHLLGYLLLNRLFSPWPRRELRQVLLILYLAFFLVSGLTISPWYFPLFVGWILFAGAWLMLQSGAPAERRRTWLPALGRQLAAAAALGAAVFLVVPRVEGLRRFNPFVASGMDKLQIRSDAVMGFTDRVSLGHFGTLRKSSARAMRVRPQHPPATPELAPSLYVRGAAFDSFDGRTWFKAPPLEFRWKAPGGRMAGTSLGRAWAWRAGSLLTFPTPGKEGDYYDVEVLPMHLAVVFTAGGAPRFIDGLNQAASFDHTDSISAASLLSTGVRYRVYPVAGPGEPTDAAQPGLRERVLELALRTPPDPDGRVKALAERWTKGLEDPKAKADAIAGHLRRDYWYSTHSDERYTSLSDFLFRSRRGNCEYFATAAAILMRHAGIPTRLISGFRADEWNEWGRFYDVRQNNAHAWTEAWIEGKGWVLYDATPAETGFSAAAEEFSHRIERWADMIQTRWYRSVIGYDQYSQRDAFLRLSFARFFERVRELSEKALTGLVPFALGLALLWLGVRAIPALLKRGDAYERAERALARKGLKRRDWQTPREFSREVAAARPELSAPLDALVDAHYARRWSGREPSPDAKRRAAALLADLKAKL